MSAFPHNLILRLGLKAFGGSEFGGYAPLAAPTAEVRTDSRRMRVFGRCTSEKVDRSREIVVASGVDWSEHRQNPICTILHGWREPDKLIGHSVIDRQYTPKMSPDGKGWDFGCQFIQHGPQAARAAEAFALVDTGVLRGISLGFRFLGAHSRQVAADDGQPALQIDRCTPFEITFLPVPDNPDAVVHVVEKGVNGRRLSQPWMDILRPMVPKTRLHGFTTGKREKAMATGKEKSWVSPGGWHAESKVRNDGREIETNHSVGGNAFRPGHDHLHVLHQDEPDGAHQHVEILNHEHGVPHATQLFIHPSGRTTIEHVSGPKNESTTHSVPPASPELRSLIATHHKTQAWMPLLDKIHEEYQEHTADAVQSHTESRNQHGTRTKGMKPMAQPMPDPATQQADPNQQQPQQPPSPASMLPQVKPSIALLMATEQYTMGFIKFLKQQGDVQDHPEIKTLIGGLILHLSQAYRALSAAHQKIQAEDPTYPNLLGHGGLLSPDPTPPGMGGAGQSPGFGDGLDDVSGTEINAGMDGMQGAEPDADNMGGPSDGDADDGVFSDSDLAGIGDQDGQSGAGGADYGDVGDEDEQPPADDMATADPDQDDEDEDEYGQPKSRTKGYQMRPDAIILVREKGLPIAFERARRMLDAYEAAFKREFQGTDVNILRFAADNLDSMTGKQRGEFKAWCREKAFAGIAREQAAMPAMDTPEYQAAVEREIAALLAARQKQ